MIKNYALIKGQDVVNVILFDDPTEELIGIFKEHHNVDQIIEGNHYTAVNGTYDGAKFWLPQPFPSWVKNEETNEWEAPIAYPQDGYDYIWSEENTAWELVDPENWQLEE